MKRKMIFYFKNLRSNKLKTRSYKLNGGMTYVELIVVLSIFATMSSIVLFNYNGFEDKVDIKILANDIALKIVEAQKSAISGTLNFNALPDWKPAYGIYFDSSSDIDTSVEPNIPFSKEFIYFADLNDPTQNNLYDYSNCGGTGECLDKIIITKGNYIQEIDSYIGDVATPITDPISITFTRPNSSAVFSSEGILLSGFDYIQITISSPSLLKAYIKVYPSGRVQIN